MKLVANDFPLFDGLKSAVMVANGLCESPITGEGLQIHHVGFHWLISASIGNHLRVYDSLNTTLTPGMRHQMAALYSPFATGIFGNLEITVICSQRQLGSSDCGLFAIANMFSLALGKDPMTVKFIQAEMRLHLVECLERKEIKMFPIYDYSISTVQRSIFNISKHCNCHLVCPDKPLIQCTKCLKRFHFECIQVTANDVANLINDEFICQRCN